MIPYFVASADCIKELKSQLQRSQASVEKLQQELREKSSKQKVTHTPRKHSEEDSEPISIPSSETDDERQSSIAASVKRRSLKRKVCLSFTTLTDLFAVITGQSTIKTRP